LLWSHALEFTNFAILFFAAAIAGAINAVAGGGSFVSFPALVLVGVPPISASATNTMALWPGNVASTGAYRRELHAQRGNIIMFSIVSLIGGLLGALLLLYTREAVFKQLIPYLLLGATVVFIASPWLTRKARALGGSLASSPLQRAGVMALYLLIAIYGGFFGAGLGILTLAVLALLGQDQIHEMNALKTLQAVMVNGIAVVTFIFAGIIQWPVVLVMIVGAIVGGYGGAAVARRVKPLYVRRLVIVISVVMTIYFFLTK
jgi:uncharacterized membrane protein YfcA